MINLMSRFKVWDIQEKDMLEGQYAISQENNISCLKEIRQNENGVYLQDIGSRDRYVVIPELPRQDQKGHVLWIGDLLSNGTENLWVIRYEFMRGVFCSLLSMPNSVYQLDVLIESGLIRVGDIFKGALLNQENQQIRKIQVNAEEWLFTKE